MPPSGHLGVPIRRDEAGAGEALDDGGSTEVMARSQPPALDEMRWQSFRVGAASLGALGFPIWVGEKSRTLAQDGILGKVTGLHRAWL